MAVTRKAGPAKARFEKALKALQDSDAKVGWFETAKYNDKNNTQVAYVATIMEYGYAPKNIPARPIMQPTIAKHAEEWKALIRSGAKAILAGNATTDSVLNSVGSLVMGQIKETIINTTSPPLKDATIAARKRQRADKKTTGSLTKPLENTHILLDTVNYTIGKT